MRGTGRQRAAVRADLSVARILDAMRARAAAEIRSAIEVGLPPPRFDRRGQRDRFGLLRQSTLPRLVEQVPSLLIEYAGTKPETTGGTK